MKLKKLRKISRRNALQLIAAFTGTAILPSMSFSQPNKALDRINEITKWYLFRLTRNCRKW